MERQNKVVLILGQKGMGKTTLAFNMIKREKFLFLDPQGQLKMNALLHVERQQKLSLSVLEHFINYGNFPSKDSGAVNYNALALHLPIEEYNKVFRVLRNMVQAGVDLNFWLVIDETQLFTDSHNLPDDLRVLISVGRQSRLSLMFIVREAQEIHKFMRSQADEIISFRQIEPASLNWSAAINGEAMTVLPTLQRRQYVYLRESVD